MVNVANEDWFNARDLKQAMALINADGGEGRIAGGAVRNSLMKIAIADVDLATTLKPEEVMERAKAAGIKAIPTGIEHGTVTLVIDGRPFEVTTLRRDVTTDGRRAEVAFTDDWQEDASRRDLTINGLYADAKGEVIDLVGGLADIETRTVRFIGDAETRIREDYLRILRYFRFFAFYGSGRPDAGALKAMAREKDGLKRLSAERVWSELKKLLSADDPGRALLWMRTAGILTLILPETEKWGIDEVPALIAAERAFGWKPDPLLRLAAIVPPDAERLAAMADRLRMSRQEADFLGQWASSPAIPENVAVTAFRRMLYRTGKAGAIVRLKLQLAIARAKAEGDVALMAEVGRLSALLKEADTWGKPVFPLTGLDVIAKGIAPGPRVGEILSVLEEEWVAGDFNADRSALLARLEALITAPSS
ncbi:CCA tRNA nucleotidyltransferase [Rhizobium sp. C1]|uniref:CCA tRNA nucleotidyltransferase n=1 Tax=Rhizobium sp. C1 TaxID=1349799 RepID=UPI001E3F3318|nr:CCA tRNA nucleotidyltransferase [Rhizobium sp. C1]MCD2176332.1 CCA tRNA nucleotidyltransferase [Rhizobium sp. C1]